MAKTLAAELLPHVGTGAAALAAWPGLEPTLRALVDRGVHAWPNLRVKPAAFLAHLGARLGADPITALEKVHAEDLYLACACTLGLTEALAAFDETHLSQIANFLDSRRARANSDELKQLLRMRLFVTRPPGIGGYTGRGALGGFVRIATVRLSRDTARGIAARGGDDGDAAQLRGASPDPELAYLKRRHAADFRQALEKTLSGLVAEERNILSLHLFDGLTTDEIGKLYRVDGSTIRRRILKLREVILVETRRLLSDRLNLRTGELDSLFVMVRSELDVSIRRCLKDPSGRS